jgi:hypothetical protein
MIGLNNAFVKDRIKSTIYEDKTAFVLHYLYPSNPPSVSDPDPGIQLGLRKGSS